MTPSERERRIEAAARGIWDDIASRVRLRGYEPHETFETTPGRDAILSNARAALDAADEAVPTVSEARYVDEAIARADTEHALAECQERAERANSLASEATRTLFDVTDDESKGIAMSNYDGPGRYRHYKGGEYEVLGLAVRENSIDKDSVENDGEQLVIYRPLTPGSLLERRGEDFWARRLDDFNAMVDREHRPVPRFTKTR